MPNEKSTPPPAGEVTEVAACGCALPATNGERRAVAVDPEIKEGNLRRLRRIEGQVRGLQRMVETDRYCPDTLVQIASVHEALRSVSRELLRNHLRHCVPAAVHAGSQEASIAEIIDLMYRHVR